VEETLAYELDELPLTYLNTAFSQKSKKEKIVKLDKQITELLQDATELEEAIMESGVTRHNIGENE